MQCNKFFASAGEVKVIQENCANETIMRTNVHTSPTHLFQSVCNGAGSVSRVGVLQTILGSEFWIKMRLTEVQFNDFYLDL